MKVKHYPTKEAALNAAIENQTLGDYIKESTYHCECSDKPVPAYKIHDALTWKVRSIHVACANDQALIH
jgi:hypothetical protein